MSRQIIESMFSVREWKSEDIALIECPGQHLHTGKNSKKDCRINLDNAPTIFCLHSSCCAVVEEMNYKMRRALWEDKPMPKREMTLEEKKKLHEAMEEKRLQLHYISNADKHKHLILKKHEWPLADVFHESPFMTDDPQDDSSLFVSKMFQPDDIIWNGNVTDSGQPANKENFRTVSDWLKVGMKGNFTSGSTFKPDTFSRSNENVLNRKYLVVESDTLTLDQTCSIFKWLRKVLELKAIVYTGGKSVHGWFNFPKDQNLFDELKISLPKMDCDPALFKPSQPVRMPGIMRGDKMQCLYWFNP